MARNDVRRVEQVMGMPITLALRADHAGVADEVFGWLRWVDRVFSPFRPASQISRIARGELAVDDAHPMVADVLRQADALREETLGYFDPRAGGTLDPSGYVKGWAVQLASDLLLARGAYDHCINAGGDVRACGTTASGRPWRIAIQDPWRPGGYRWVVEGEDLAVATSGTYARGGHVIDPHTGRPATDLVSVTVIGPDLALADAYATAALAMGGSARGGLAVDWLSALPTLSALPGQAAPCQKQPSRPAADQPPNPSPLAPTAAFAPGLSSAPAARLTAAPGATGGTTSWTPSDATGGNADAGGTTSCAPRSTSGGYADADGTASCAPRGMSGGYGEAGGTASCVPRGMSGGYGEAGRTTSCASRGASGGYGEAGGTASCSPRGMSGGNAEAGGTTSCVPRSTSGGYGEAGRTASWALGGVTGDNDVAAEGGCAGFVGYAAAVIDARGGVWRSADWPCDDETQGVCA